MLIDRSHRRWLAGCAGLIGAAIIAYAIWRHFVPERPIGNTALGITFGASALSIMVFECLIGVRKALPAWRIGRLDTWMAAHLWLGLTAVGFVCLHTGLRRGGVLTTSMLVMFAAVVASGVFGALMQQFIPRMMTASVPLETVYEQIDRVRQQLIEEADSLVATISAQKSSAAKAVSAGESSLKVQTDPQEPDDVIGSFYATELRPFLLHTGIAHERLGHGPAAESVFRQLRVMSEPPLHPVIDDLESICEEKRQLDRQRTLHHWLHWWILIHGPLALALLCMIAAHAFMSLRY